MNDDEFRWKLSSDSVHLVLKRARCISLHSNGRYGSALTGGSGRKNRNNHIIIIWLFLFLRPLPPWWRIPVLCQGFLDCGSSRGRTETVFLYECRDDVTTHLKTVFCRVQIWKNTRSSCKGLASTVSWRSENITCLCSPSLWYERVLEAFKAVSLSRAGITYQRQKSWRDQPCHGQGGVSVVWYICADRLT